MAKTFTGSLVVLILLLLFCWPAALIYFLVKYQEQPMVYMPYYGAPPVYYQAPPPPAYQTPPSSVTAGTNAMESGSLGPRPVKYTLPVLVILAGIILMMVSAAQGPMYWSSQDAVSAEEMSRDTQTSTPENSSLLLQATYRSHPTGSVVRVHATAETVHWWEGKVTITDSDVGRVTAGISDVTTIDVVGVDETYFVRGDVRGSIHEGDEFVLAGRVERVRVDTYLGDFDMDVVVGDPSGLEVVHVSQTAWAGGGFGLVIVLIGAVWLIHRWRASRPPAPYIPSYGPPYLPVQYAPPAYAYYPPAYAAPYGPPAGRTCPTCGGPLTSAGARSWCSHCGSYV